MHTCTFSPFVVKTESSHSRADLRISFPTADFYIDLTVINSFCKTHKNKSSEALYSEKEKLKENLYLKHVEAKSSSFITFSVEVNGRFSKAAQTMISKIENYADKKGELKQKLLSQLHQCNAQILLNAASLLN